MIDDSQAVKVSIPRFLVFGKKQNVFFNLVLK